MKLSVIIPTYNRSKTLRDTLESLRKQSLPAENYEIIVVDNNSTDNTREVVEEFSKSSLLPRVRYVLEKRQGVHYARNVAIAVAESELLFYTDDDIIADIDLLAEISKPFDASNIGSVGGRVYPKWTVPPPDWVLKYFADGTFSVLDIGDKQRVLNIPHIWSCNMAVTKEVLVKYGGFHPESTKLHYVGDGETGLLLKFLRAGLKLVYQPTAVVWHVIPASRLTQEYMNLRMFNQGVSDSYGYYREHRPGMVGLVWRIVFEATIGGIMMARHGIERILGMDRWHLSMAWGTCWLSRMRYDYRLLVDSEHRRFTLIDDWITNG